MKFHKASDNIFDDLGFDRDEAANLRIRSDLMIAIMRIMRARNLKQQAAAELFGVQQPRISDLLHSKIESFTIDALINMLVRADVKVGLQIGQTNSVSPYNQTVPSVTEAATQSEPLASSKRTWLGPIAKPTHSFQHSTHQYAEAYFAS